MRARPSCGNETEADARFCAQCGSPLGEPAPSREVRKTVTVVFCDVTGSTALGEMLEPESFRRVIARYFEVARVAVEAQGGTVEKFIGDAVMAVFGVPVVREDDALRAVRAADDLRRGLVGLNEELRRDFGVALELRIGVNTGQVVTGTAERLATGDAVNVAARLETAAAPGEILLGELTASLVRDAVDVEPVGGLTLKGKSEPVAAYRLRAVVGDEGRRRRLETPLVGRERELRLLTETWERVRGGGGCHLFTLLGPPGVGKTRLAAELVERAGGARVLQTRCLSFGEGITYKPVVELLGPLLGDEPVAALDALGIDPAAAVAVAGLLGAGPPPASTDEIAWAVRKVIEAAAEREPLVLVLDDVHWGAEAFLDLVDHVADWSRDAPILLLCLARADLLDRRPAWGGGKVNATTVLLESLAPSDTEELVGLLLDDVTVADALRARILAGADGNPLFVEEMIAMVHERGPDAALDIPPTVQALLAARLDALDATERSVLERGAVEGQVFHLSSVRALAPGDGDPTGSLAALVRREIVRPGRGERPGDDAFRFRHILIRDAAYEAMPKARRADLHERFAYRLETEDAALVDRDELAGHHLEQSYRYHAELGPLGPAERAIAARAFDHLSAAGVHAWERGDANAASVLLGRALELLPPDEPAVGIRLAYTLTLMWLGRADDAQEAAARAEMLAEAAADRDGALRARLQRLGLQLSQDTRVVDELRAALAEALPRFEERGDDRSLLSAWTARADVASVEMRYDEMAAASRAAAACARRLGDAHATALHQMKALVAQTFGRTPYPAAARWVSEQEWVATARPVVLSSLAMYAAARGSTDEARRQLAEAQALLADLATHALRLAEPRWNVERLAGDEAAALQAIEEAVVGLESRGMHGHLATVLAYGAISLAALGRLDEAEAWAERGRALGGDEDVATEAIARQALAAVALHRGDTGSADAHLRQALALARPTDDIILQGEVILDLAGVRTAAGDGEEAAALASEAAALFEEKQHLVLLERARAVAAGTM